MNADLRNPSDMNDANELSKGDQKLNADGRRVYSENIPDLQYNNLAGQQQIVDQ